ncbi:hypothetical protein LINGRAHAP2_LOCUS3401, partial [Linum grandiflorum]
HEETKPNQAVDVGTTFFLVRWRWRPVAGGSFDGWVQMDKWPTEQTGSNTCKKGDELASTNVRSIGHMGFGSFCISGDNFSVIR